MVQGFHVARSPLAHHKSPLANGQKPPTKQQVPKEPTSSYKADKRQQQHNLFKPETVIEPAASAFCNAPAVTEMDAEPAAVPEAAKEAVAAVAAEAAAESQADIEATPSVEEPELPSVGAKAPVIVLDDEESPEMEEALKVLKAYRKRVKELLKANQASSFSPYLFRP